eukprot:5046117-Pyramimonas_sp.AAC.1
MASRKSHGTDGPGNGGSTTVQIAESGVRPWATTNVLATCAPWGRSTSDNGMHGERREDQRKSTSDHSPGRPRKRTDANVRLVHLYTAGGAGEDGARLSGA